MQSEGQTWAHSVQPMQVVASILILLRPSYGSSAQVSD